MLMITILLAAAILVYALRCKRDVKFNLKVWGASFLLEAKDQGIRNPETDHHPDRNEIERL